ncbi:MAG TPA: MBL fold metallo-hydrolase, partial [Gammaproteobacteria bacterium]|nr:MBL fold metallo-hydrolase [Gammaproteobacteria bacterium]
MHLITIAALTLLTSIPVASFADILPIPRQLAPHSYAWIGPYGPPAEENRGFRMNLGFVVGNDAVAVIDSGYGDEMATAMLAQIRQITDRPVRYVINTNSQPHRILGNAVLRKYGATVIASEGASPRMANEGAVMASTAENILGLTPGSIHAPG